VRALIAFLLLAACDAGQKPAPPAPPPKPAEQHVDGLDLTYLPASSDLVIRIDVKTLQTATLWKQHAPKFWSMFLPAFASCSDDPLRGVTSITMGVPIESGLGVYVVRGIDRDQAMACVSTSKRENVTHGAGVITVEHKAGEHSMMTFADATTLVMQAADKPTKETLVQVLATGAPLANDAELLAAYKRISRAPLVMVSRRSGKLDEKWAKLGFKATETYATMHVGDRLDIRFVMVMKTADEATQLAKTMKTQFEILKTYFDRLNAVAQGTTLTLDAGMTETQLSMLMKSMAGMLGN
jgi:hypothetical protein